MNKVSSVRELEVYRAAFVLQQSIFRFSKSFPKDETYSLTDQIRRSSRSVGANLSEACGYIDIAVCADLQAPAVVIGRQLGSMINRYESFCF